MSNQPPLACLDPWIGFHFSHRSSYGFCCVGERYKVPPRGIMPDFNGSWAQHMRQRFAAGGRCRVPALTWGTKSRKCQDALGWAFLKPGIYRGRAYGKGPDKAFLAALEDRKQNVLARAPVAQHPPLKLVFVADLTCNLNCLICAQRSIVKAKGDTPFTRIPDALFDEAQALQDRIGFFHISGGEPFASKRTTAFLTKLADAKSPMQLVIPTNGTAINHDLLEALNVDRINFSIDGATPDTFEVMRPGADFYTVMSNLLRVVAWRRKRELRLPCVAYVFCRATLADVPLAIDLFDRSLGLAIGFQNKRGNARPDLNWDQAPPEELRLACSLVDTALPRARLGLTRRTLRAQLANLRRLLCAAEKQQENRGGQER